MPIITTFLLFDAQAEEAANFYVSIFKDASIKSITRYGDAGPAPKGLAMTVNFVLNGHEFVALNGPKVSPTDAVSFAIECDDQEEIDYYWNALTAGGQESQCGWLKDKYGMSWQVNSRRLVQLLSGPDPAKSGRAMQAMLKMKKIDLAVMQKAYDG